MCTKPEKVLKKTFLIEFILDCLWVVNMGMCLTTAYVKDVDMITDVSSIALKYLKEGFIIDVVTTFSTLLTFYYYPGVYYIKVLRLYYIPRS